MRCGLALRLAPFDLGVYVAPSVMSFVRLSCISWIIVTTQLGMPELSAQKVSLLHRMPLLANGADAPLASASADTKTIMDRVKKQAAREHKEILVKFSASWCGPCHLWDVVLADPPVKAIVDPRFVIVDLDAAENAGDTKHQETPGAQAYMTSLGNKGINLPFIAFLKPSGELIFNSIRPSHGSDQGGLIGYPEDAELDWFLGKLHETHPSMSDADLATIRQSFVSHDRKRPGH